MAGAVTVAALVVAAPAVIVDVTEGSGSQTAQALEARWAAPQASTSRPASALLAANSAHEARAPQPTGFAARPAPAPPAEPARATTANTALVAAAQSSGAAAVSGQAMDARMARLAREVSPLVKSYDMGVMVRDNRSGRTWSCRGGKSENMASLTKLGTAVAVFLEADRKGRKVTDEERRLMRRSLQVSDNDAQTALWNRIGRHAGFDRNMRRLGLSADTHSARGYGWGRSFSTPRDQVSLMTKLLDGKAPIKRADADWILKTMRGVSADQIWGAAPFGKAKGRVVEVKNGWSPYSDTGRWRLTSLGHIKDARHDYTIAILSDGWRSQGAGVSKLNAVGNKVYAILSY